MDAFTFNKRSKRLAISGEFTIYQAAEARTALLAAIDSGSLEEIDLSGVTELDTAGLQLLLLAKQAQTADGSPVRLVKHSQPVLEVLALTRLAAELDAPEDSHGH